MLKPIFCSIVLSLLAGSALADDTATYRIDFSLSTEGAGHKDTLFLTDNMCGEMSSKGATKESSLRVCARPIDSKHVRLDIDRRFRDKADEKKAQAVIVATAGTAISFLDAKLTMSVQ